MLHQHTWSSHNCEFFSGTFPITSNVHRGYSEGISNIITADSANRKTIFSSADPTPY